MAIKIVPLVLLVLVAVSSATSATQEEQPREKSSDVKKRSANNLLRSLIKSAVHAELTNQRAQKRINGYGLYEDAENSNNNNNSDDREIDQVDSDLLNHIIARYRHFEAREARRLRPRKYTRMIPCEDEEIMNPMFAC